jgi:transposase
MTVRDYGAHSKLFEMKVKWELQENYLFSRQSLEKGVPMEGIIPKLRFTEKEKLLRHLRECRQADLKIRYLILVNLINGRSPCPWSKGTKTRRLNAISRLIAGLPKGAVVVYEDEVDIHLNPKIGWDWMVRGQQKEVFTPGQNVKRYLAGTLDVTTGRLVRVEGERKNSGLFIGLLEKLIMAYSKAKRLHVIVDNFRIHTSRMTQMAVKAWNGKRVLHFLPPYCPNDNRIERVWEDLHANVTRNHRCSSIQALMDQVHRWLKRRNRTMMQSYRKKAA